jgi:hypothetical protein
MAELVAAQPLPGKCSTATQKYSIAAAENDANKHLFSMYQQYRVRQRPRQHFVRQCAIGKLLQNPEEYLLDVDAVFGNFQTE